VCFEREKKKRVTNNLYVYGIERERESDDNNNGREEQIATHKLRPLLITPLRDLTNLRKKVKVKKKNLF